MISGIRLQSFRSYENASFEFNSGVNIIVGPNASGKTNLLESILVVASGASYRASDADIVREGADWSRVDVINSESERSVKLEKLNGKINKSFVIDGKDYKRLSVDKSLPVVLFEPNNLRLINGGPERRRDYLDTILSSTVSGYSAMLRHYKRVLAQRNSLLKQIRNASSSQLFVWNLRLSELAGQISKYRLELVKNLNSQASNTYSDLAGNKNLVEIDYVSSCNIKSYESSLLHKLETNIANDIDRGFTGHGPHRDDLLINLNGQAAATTASRGEVRTLVLMLKVNELIELERARNQKPLLLLDDVFSELDGRRRQSLTRYLEQYQTFITTTDADVVLHDFTNEVNILLLQNQ